MVTATVRCRDLSAVSGQSVIGTLQRLFRDIGDTGHEPNWQHVAVGAVRMIPHRAAAAPDFLHSIRSRRGDKAAPAALRRALDQRLLRPTERIQHPPGQASQTAQSQAAQSEPAVQDDDGIEMEEDAHGTSPMPDTIEEAHARITHYRTLWENEYKQQNNRYRKDARTIAHLQQQVDEYKATAERFSYHAVPKRLRTHSLSQSFSADGRGLAIQSRHFCSGGWLPSRTEEMSRVCGHQ